MKHDLKILPAFFEAVLRGDKKFEIRRNDDRGFQKGDVIVLIEYDDKNRRKTGREVIAEITYVSDYHQPPNQVVFGFKVFDQIT